LNSFFLSI